MSDFLIESISKESLEQINKMVERLNEGIESVIKMNKQFKDLKLPSEVSQGFSKVNEEVTKSNKTVSDYVALQKKLANTEKQLIQSKSTLGKQIIKNREEIKRNNKATRDEINSRNKSIAQIEKEKKARESQVNKESQLRQRLLAQRKREEAQNARLEAQRKKELNIINILNGAYKKQSLQLDKSRQKAKDLAVQYGVNSKRAKQAALEVRKLDRRLKAIDKTVGQSQRSVGNYGLALKNLGRNLLGSLGVVGGVSAFVSVVKSSFNVVKEFDQAQADLSAVLGQSREETKALTDQAKLLGATTAFTATQVSQLQLELSKLGFNESQILAATRGVENLAIATGVEASRAAKLAGAALRGFNLDASESNRVAAALAVSTTKSASSFQTLEIALPKVSAIAKSFGFTIEDTTALLGGLQNAGFEASVAGTSLRQIFLQLADENGKLAQRLGGGASNFDELIDQFIKLEDEGISLGEAFNLTNARSVAAFKTFLQGAEDLRTLRNNITDVEDELTKLADTKLDSIQGEITLLNSAWDGFILSLEDGNNSLGQSLRSGLEQATESIGRLSAVTDDNISLFDRWKISVNTYSKSFRTFIPFIEKGNGLFEDEVQILIRQNIEVSKATKELSKMNDEYIKIYGSLAPLTQEQLRLNQAVNSFNFGRTPYDDDSAKTYSLTVAEINELIKEQQSLLTGANSRSQAKPIQDEIARLELLKQSILGVKDARTQSSKGIEKQTTLIKNITDAIKAESKALKERLELSEGFDNLTDADSITDGLVTAEDGELLDSLNLSLAKTRDEIEAIRQAQYNLASEDILFESFGRLENQLGIQAGTFESLFEGITLGFDDAGEAAQAFGNLATGVFANITAASNERLQNEQANLEIEKATAIEFAGDSQAAREEIERRYDQKQKEIRRKQVQNEKAQALFEIGISTAVGVIKALAMTPPNIPLSIAIGGIGLAQAAIVASRPIPQFKDGVRGFEGGTAMINDQKGSNYQEIVRTPDGKMRKYSGRDILLNLPKGSDVLSAGDTIKFENEMNNILGDSGINPLGSSLYGRTANPMIINAPSGGITKQEMQSIMARSIAKQPKQTTVWDKKGVTTFVQNGHSKKVILNNKVTFTGQEV